MYGTVYCQSALPYELLTKAAIPMLNAYDCQKIIDCLVHPMCFQITSNKEYSHGYYIHKSSG